MLVTAAELALPEAIHNVGVFHLAGQFGLNDERAGLYWLTRKTIPLASLKALARHHVLKGNILECKRLLCTFPTDNIAWELGESLALPETSSEVVEEILSQPWWDPILELPQLCFSG